MLQRGRRLEPEALKSGPHTARGPGRSPRRTKALALRGERPSRRPRPKLLQIRAGPFGRPPKRHPRGRNTRWCEKHENLVKTMGFYEKPSVPPTPTLVALDPPPKCASSKPMSGGGSADAADARGSGGIIGPSYLMGLRGPPGPRPRDPADAHDACFGGGGGGVPTAENLVNTDCFVGPRKIAPKIAHFTRSNGFVPTSTKHPNSRTPNALKGIRGLAFGGVVGTQAFKHI